MPPSLLKKVDSQSEGTAETTSTTSPVTSMTETSGNEMKVEGIIAKWEQFEGQANQVIKKYPYLSMGVALTTGYLAHALVQKALGNTTKSA